MKSPVTSITDEQLADIEGLASSTKHWNMPKAFQEAEEGVHPNAWEWHVGAIDEDGNQYPLLHVNAHQYESNDSGLLARYYAACNQSAIIGLITRLRAAEADAKRFRHLMFYHVKWQPDDQAKLEFGPYPAQKMRATIDDEMERKA